MKFSTFHMLSVVTLWTACLSFNTHLWLVNMAYQFLTNVMIRWSCDIKIMRNSFIVANKQDYDSPWG